MTSSLLIRVRAKRLLVVQVETVHSLLVSFSSASSSWAEVQRLAEHSSKSNTITHGKVLSESVEGNEMKLKFQWNLLVVVSQNQIGNKTQQNKTQSFSFVIYQHTLTELNRN